MGTPKITVSECYYGLYLGTLRLLINISEYWQEAQYWTTAVKGNSTKTDATRNISVEGSKLDVVDIKQAAKFYKTEQMRVWFAQHTEMLWSKYKEQKHQ